MIPRLRDWPTAAALLLHPSASPASIRAFQDRHLRRLVRHAWERVPFYRALFERHGVHPDHIRGVEDLHRLPITSKADLQERPMPEVVARGYEHARLLRRTTSGSQGRPFAIWRSRAEDDLLRVAVTRTGLYHGYRPTQRHVSVVYPRARGDSTRIGRAVRGSGLFRFEEVDCRLDPEMILDRLRALRPGFLSGYSGTLARVARLVDGDDPSLRPSAVVVGSEVMTETMRRQIEAGFRAPVFNTYGSHEFARIAYGCRSGTLMHVCDDTVLTEVLVDGRPAREGERGEVVATALHSRAMPFLRYRLGDLVTRGPDSCTCGAPFTTISEVQGRTVDFFLLPDGRSMHPYDLMGTLVEAIPDWWIEEYQLVQERRDRIVFRTVPLRAPTPEELAMIRFAAGNRLGPTIEFEVDIVPEIPLTAGGKFRTYRSFVESEHDARTEEVESP